MVAQINYLNKNYTVNFNKTVDIQCNECLNYYTLFARDLTERLYNNKYYVFVCNNCQEKNAKLVLIKKLKEQKYQEQNKKRIEQQNLWKNNSFVLNTEFIQYE